jgi:hypothetical protein
MLLVQGKEGKVDEAGLVRPVDFSLPDFYSWLCPSTAIITTSCHIEESLSCCYA